MLHDFHSFIPSKNNKSKRDMYGFAMWAFIAITFRNRNTGGYKGYHFVEDWVKTIVIFGAFYIAFTNLIAEPYRIPTGSMEPTFYGIPDTPGKKTNHNSPFNLFKGDHILAWKGISKFDKIRRGDIVAFVSIDNPDMFVIKRVVGLPGERIKVKSPYIYINGKKLTSPEIFTKNKYSHMRKHPYLDPITNEIKINEPYEWACKTEVKIPKDCYFVMGDNSDNSRDSRVWGWLPKSHILGKATSIWLPFSRATTVEVNEIFGD